MLRPLNGLLTRLLGESHTDDNSVDPSLPANLFSKKEKGIVFIVCLKRFNDKVIYDFL